MFSLLNLLALAAPHAARAGYYTVIYTGGSSVVTNYDPVLYNDRNGPWGGACSCDVFSDGNGNANSADADCSGTITATFTWNNGGNPNDKPPKSAILTQYCDVSWEGDEFGGVSLSGDCNNPLGGSPMTSPYGDGEDWEYTLYTVKTDPGLSFTITCAPSAHAGGAGSGTPSGYGNGIASVYYSVTADPVTVPDPPDVTKVPNDDTVVNTLYQITGRSVSATLNSRYPVDDSTYQWSATGDVFYTYNEHAPSH